jgi:hypothetical protein
MSTIRTKLILGSLVLGAWTLSAAADDQKIAIQERPLKHSVSIEEIQPGFGNIMREIAYRLTNGYWAAQGGNWGLAQYQFQMLERAMESGVRTTPKLVQMLRPYELTYLEPLTTSIENKNIDQFNGQFLAALTGCNSCHKETGFGFILYELRDASGGTPFLDYGLQTEPRTNKAKR